MATATFPLPSRGLASGLNTFQAPFNSGQHTGFQLGLDLTSWTASDSISVTIRFSNDSGATWVGGCGFTATGGPHTAIDGITPAMPNCGSDFPFLNQSCLVRVQVTVPRAGNISGQLVLS